jgi:hypothetical protein
MMCAGCPDAPKCTAVPAILNFRGAINIACDAAVGLIDGAHDAVSKILRKPPSAAIAERFLAPPLPVPLLTFYRSTAIAAQLDPEEWRETVRDYQRTAAEAITRFGGHVAQHLGDGIVAFFGWPEAQDNDAERAAPAGLAVLEAILKLGERPASPEAVGSDWH